MTEYRTSYIPQVEALLGRSLTEMEILLTIPRYNDDWTPEETAGFWKKNDEVMNEEFFAEWIS